MTVMSPAQAAAELNIHERTLRRFAAAYETVYGPLPRSSRGYREFPVIAVERLAEAQPRLREQPSLSMEGILKLLGGDEPSRQLTTEVLPASLEALRDEVAALRREVAVLRDLLEQGRSQPVGQPDSRLDVGELDWVSGRSDNRTADRTPRPSGKRERNRGGNGRRGQTERLALTVPVLRVVSTTVPRGIKWKPEKYETAEALLREGETLHAHGVDYCTASGQVMNWRTAEALVKLGVLSFNETPE